MAQRAVEALISETHPDLVMAVNVSPRQLSGPDLLLCVEEAIAMGLRPDQARASIRFSLGKQTTEADIDFALALVPDTVARLRTISPTYTKQAVST